MKDIEYVKPETLNEALQVLQSRPDAKCLAGGQSLVNIMKLRLASPRVVVDLNGLAELKKIEKVGEEIEFGAMATYHDIANHETVRTLLPIVSDVADHIADRQVRNRGTIGGNCCFNDPTCNFPPLLAVLQAEFAISGKNGIRRVSVDDFFLEPYRTVVKQAEILVSVRIPIPDGQWGTSYLSLRVGNDGPAILHASAFVKLEEDRFSACRVAIGCVENAPYRPVELERWLIGRKAESTVVAEAIREAMRDVKGIDDSHGTAAYREEMARVYVRRALDEAIRDARGRKPWRK